MNNMEKAHVDVPSFFAFPVRGWHNIRIFRGCREGRGASFHHQPDFAILCWYSCLYL